MTEFECLPMCSLCIRPAAITPFKKCGACKIRTYCSKTCQISDWKHGNHKHFCGAQLHKNPTHHPCCAYLDRNPKLDNDNVVNTNKIKSNPREVITVGMNTCFFIVIKTTKEVIGWHASLASDLLVVRKKLKTISKSEILSGFIVPGEDREAGTLDLKPTCRQMRLIPFTDPTHSRRIIMGFLKQFEWYEQLEVVPPVKSYKDFVVFDMVHTKPFAFSDVAQFDEGCSFDAGLASAPRYS